MKVIAKTVFFYGNRVYKRGEVLEVRECEYDPRRMDHVEEPVKKTKKKKE